MQEIYRRPLRVYVVLAFLALAGVIAGFQLPISLFPNSSQPTIGIWVNYGDMSAEEFRAEIGQRVEGELPALLVDGHRVEHVWTSYWDNQAAYRVQFEWDTDGQKALHEVRNAMDALASGWPEEIRRSYNVGFNNENGGFLAISFFSQERSLQEAYEILNPILKPGLAGIQDADQAALWSPQEQNVEVSLDAEKMAGFQVFPSDVEVAINGANQGISGGALNVGEGKTLDIFIPRVLKGGDDVANVIVRTRSGQAVQIKDIATIRLAVDKHSLQSFKTNGTPSLILHASPRAGGNVKRMADETIALIERSKHLFPKDIGYRVLVNPSEFIDSSISGVFREVALAAFLAVAILFLFIGSLRNVITAAIEIPMSMVMAFILMKIFNMNLNLISLGGLALSAGMNVDASVVVMENIFRHFEDVKERLGFEQRLALISKAVNEVKAPIISSTIASLVVFIPLIMTRGLTNAILGDLAKAVVFSHSLSAVVALVLVPTIRLQLMGRESRSVIKSPIEGTLAWLEDHYGRALEYFLSRKSLQRISYALVLVALVGLSFGVLPRLPKEIIGRPETDWIVLNVWPQNFTDPSQLSNLVERIEMEVLKKYEDDMQYTFTQQHGASWAQIMIRLKDKKIMSRIWKGLEAEYTNTPDINYGVNPWNPSELKIPDPPHFRAEIRGGTPLARAETALDLRFLLEGKEIFPSVWQRPGFSGKEKAIIVTPQRRTLFELAKANSPISDYDLGNMMRVATEGKIIAYLDNSQRTYKVQLRYPSLRVSSLYDLRGLPIGVQDRVLPFSALAEVTEIDKPAPIYMEDQAFVDTVEARVGEAQKSELRKAKADAHREVTAWTAANQSTLQQREVSVDLVDPDVDLNQAIDQLKWAILFSVALIFLTMVLQFGDLVHAALVLIAIPLGVIGVLLSLWIFSSSLSLNSVLGVILLNGISVANSVILVDFMKRLVDQGEVPGIAALRAAKTRLRPIVMTSLTTILGMMPIALGWGEGGKILQPLGIAVSGGLWVSMLCTLFLVPSLQVTYLQWKTNRISVRGAR